MTKSASQKINLKAHSGLWNSYSSVEECDLILLNGNAIIKFNLNSVWYREEYEAKNAILKGKRQGPKMGCHGIRR